MDALGISIEDTLKKAAILYDKIFYYTPYFNASNLDVRENLIYLLQNLTGNHKELPYLDELFLVTKESMDDFITDYSKNVHLRENNYEWREKHRQLMDVFKRHTFEHYSYKQLFENSLNRAKPLVEEYYNTLLVESNISAYMSNHKPEYDVFTTPLHIDFQRILYDFEPIDERKIFGNIIRGEIYDFSLLAWSDILILRKSEFAKSFREKFTDWLNSSTIDHENELVNKINNYIYDSKFSFIEANKPNTAKSIFTGILSNIPFPLANPFSVIDSVRGITREVKTKKDFGWLMYLQEVHSKLNENNDT